MSTPGQTPPIVISDSEVETVSLGVSSIRWDAGRERIYSWLRDQGGPGFAEAFKGAALLMQLKPPAYVRFVCHALRDITNGLPAVIAKKSGSRCSIIS